MRSSFHSRQNTAGTSSFLANGERGAVAPISALKLFRIGIKRRRGEGSACYDTSKGREAVDANGNVNGLSIDVNSNGENDDLPLSSPPSSSSLLCLMNNPFFSLPLGITELAGPAGVGKTQIALSLCADCVQQQQEEEQQQQHSQQQQQGKIYQNKNKAVFIQLGGSSRFLQTASRRLEQMLRSRIKDDEIIHDCLTRVLVHWICNSEELTELLQTSLPRLLCMHPTISIVVLDGIANLFRLLPEQQQHQPSTSNPWHDRAVTFFQISNLCKELSSRFEIPFVVLNECTSRIPTAVVQQQHQQQPKAVLEPALGLAWSQCVNCSFFVRRCESPTRTSNNATTVLCRNNRKIDQSSTRKKNCNIGNKQQQGGCSRILQCLRAPHISSEHSTAKFWIDRSGVIPI
jgi:RecA/RadA recombinase